MGFMRIMMAMLLQISPTLQRLVGIHGVHKPTNIGGHNIMRGKFTKTPPFVWPTNKRRVLPVRKVSEVCGTIELAVKWV